MALEASEHKRSLSKKTADRQKPPKSGPRKTKVTSAADDSIVAKMKGAREAPLPDFVEPQLATLVKSAPSGKRWLHEIKLDGYRLQARISRGKVSLLTRKGLDWTHKFGDAITGALEKLSVSDAIIDGEVAVEASSGATDFSLLQQDLSDGRRDRFTFYAFDLLYLDGHDLAAVPLLQRKEVLETLLESSDAAVRYSQHFGDEGGIVLKHACRLSLEGIISKVATAPYRAGRGRDWVKSKCSARQEFVVAGYVPSSVSKTAIGSLVMGYYESGKFRHAGRVGTGYSQAMAERLFKRLEELRLPKSPFNEKLTAVERKDVVYLKPDLVAEVEFRGWTADAHIRHAAFRGLREDKDPKDIVREGAADAEETPPQPKRTVNLTHPDRVYWSDAGVTKAGLADYYSQVWRLMAPFVVNRPLALLRGPDGIKGQLFFQKHGWKGMTKNAVLVKDPADPDEEDITIRDLDGLLGLVQGASLEIHPWGSTVNDWEKPDMVNIDLDPGEGVSWDRTIAAAHEVKRRFENMGLMAFVKTSGGKGLHVVAPVKPQAEWPQVKAAMKALADGMAADEPDQYVSTITKSKRTGKILIDYLRNGRGNTAVAPYSTRARPGAPVSMPLEWEELTDAIAPNYFTVANAAARIAQQARDPWADFRKAEAPIVFKEKR
jgi:bifunctional non-homologous end joining protein LigD